MNDDTVDWRDFWLTLAMLVGAGLVLLFLAIITTPTPPIPTP